METKTTKKDPFLFNDIQLVADQSFSKLCHSKLSTSQTNYKPNQKRLQWFTFEYAMIFITIDINVKYPSNMFKESITQQVRQEDGTIGQTLKQNKRDGNIVVAENLSAH